MIASPSLRSRSSLQCIADNNPFYLLSAASMLLACVLLSNSTSWSPIALYKLIGLISTLAFYELLLVGLGIYLITVRKLTRDGLTLLVLEAFFLSDVSFLASEAYQESLAAGLLLNGALLLLGIVKLVAIFRVLCMRIFSPPFLLAVITHLVLLGHPALLKYLSVYDRGHVPALAFYLIWWVIGVLIIAYALLIRRATPTIFKGDRPLTRNPARHFIHVLMSVLLCSLTAHLATAHWVYKCAFYAADMSPPLLALAVLLLRLPDNRFLQTRQFAALNVFLAAIAFVTSMEAPDALRFMIRHHEISPEMLASGGVYLVIVDHFGRRYFLRWIGIGFAVASSYIFGPSWTAMRDATLRIFSWASDLASSALPRSQSAWGAFALIGSFVFLAVGAGVSLLRPKPSSDAEPPPEAGQALPAKN